MGLLSIFKRQAEPPPTEAAAEPDAVALARVRSRRRLIGATVLLVLGIVGFPLLFETQPRPVGNDIAIEMPRKDGAPPAPASVAVKPMASAPAAVATDAPAEPAPAEITEKADEQGRERPAPVAVPVPARAVASRPAVLAAAPSRPLAAASKPAAPAPRASAAPTTGNDEAARARALLEGQASAAPATPASSSAVRIVVQVGAYTDPDKLREARQKVEALGFKTYTQVVESEAGKRTRVRVGPFGSKAEADKAAARIKATGLPAAQLTL